MCNVYDYPEPKLEIQELGCCYGTLLTCKAVNFLRHGIPQYSDGEFRGTEQTILRTTTGNMYFCTEVPAAWKKVINEWHNPQRNPRNLL